jgi:hypothetical protein
MNRRQETRLKKLGAIEQVRSARARRYVFHPDEVPVSTCLWNSRAFALWMGEARS